MLDYDKKKSGIQLYDSLDIRDRNGRLDADRLHQDISDDVDIVVNQARQACRCDDKTIEQLHKDQENVSESYTRPSLEVCLPCQARAALNAMRGVCAE